jgi:hypothetical protein
VRELRVQEHGGSSHVRLTNAGYPPRAALRRADCSGRTLRSASSELGTRGAAPALRDDPELKASDARRACSRASTRADTVDRSGDGRAASCPRVRRGVRSSRRAVRLGARTARHLSKTAN